MEEVKGYIHSVETFGTLDGPGIRYVVFFSGCPLRCLYCHNPDTWHTRGRETTSVRVVADILKYRNFIKSGGVTLSGGEPLYQPEFALEILNRCKLHGIHTALDTSGAVPLDHCCQAVRTADLILLDIKALDDGECRALTGRGNADALAMLNFRQSENREVVIRHVVVPGITLDPEKLEKLARFLKPYSCVTKVELLPFHKMGEYKWEDLGLDYTLKETKEPTDREMEMANAIFKRYGFQL